MALNIKHPAWLTGSACLFLTVASGAQAAPPVTVNVPVDSAYYSYIDKLSAMGYLKSMPNGARPYSRLQLARWVREARPRAVPCRPIWLMKQRLWPNTLHQNWRYSMDRNWRIRYGFVTYRSKRAFCTATNKHTAMDRESTQAGSPFPTSRMVIPMAAMAMASFLQTFPGISIRTLLCPSVPVSAMTGTTRAVSPWKKDISSRRWASGIWKSAGKP